MFPVVGSFNVEALRTEERTSEFLVSIAKLSARGLMIEKVPPRQLGALDQQARSQIVWNGIYYQLLPLGRRLLDTIECGREPQVLPINASSEPGDLESI